MSQVVRQNCRVAIVTRSRGARWERADKAGLPSRDRTGHMNREQEVEGGD